MAPPGEDPLRPGPRSLLASYRHTTVPTDVVELLQNMGQGCNYAALALLGAQLQFAHTQEAFFRYDEPIAEFDEVGSVVVECHLACRDHVERLTSIYARAAADYAVCAVQIASRVADGKPAAVPEPLPVLPSDVLTLTEVHLPLLQIPEWAVASEWRPRLGIENSALARDHQVLMSAMRAVENPSRMFDGPDEVPDRDKGYLLEAEFPSAMHNYASTCVSALAQMSRPE